VTTQAPTSIAVASLGDVERVVGGWCDRTDPAVYSGSDAAAVVERLARVVRRLTAKQASFAVNHSGSVGGSDPTRETEPHACT
jgi:hypothetical protein